MSNHKNVYGWSGHLLVEDDALDSDPDHNLVAIPRATFNRIKEALDQIQLDQRIDARRIGITDGDFYLATGTGFSRGFEHYGTVFEEAELRASPGPPFIDHDAEYMKAMKEIYGLDLPPCKLMIGCSSEH